MTEWQYNWNDQVTNIVHKTSGGTVPASVLYERAAGGEPTKVTREDGTYGNPKGSDLHGATFGLVLLCSKGLLCR